MGGGGGGAKKKKKKKKKKYSREGKLNGKKIHARLLTLRNIYAMA